MKYQLFCLSLLGTVLGVSLFGEQPSQAEPALVFQSLIPEIRDRLPAEFSMRLPAVLPEFTNDLDLYAFIPDDDIKVIGVGNKEVFSVLVSDVPDCAEKEDPEKCIVGVISVTEALSELPLQPEDLPDNHQDLTPVTLTPAATGFYFTQSDEIQLVVWEQDNLGYLLLAEKCEDECISQQELIEVAKSAANEPPIVSSDLENN